MKLFLKIFTKEKMIELLPYMAIALFIIIFDQWTKYYVSNNFYIGENVNVINGFLKFTHVHNKGAAFSFGSLFSDEVRLVIFKILPVFVGVFLLKFIYSNKETTMMRYAYSLILGGGVGNVIDRIRLDYVIDFISVYHTGFNLFGIELKPWYFAIFNIADSAVTIAAFLIIMDYILNRKKHSPAEPEDTSKKSVI